MCQARERPGPSAADVKLRPAPVADESIGPGRPGTFANGTKSNKIDYILLSPALFAKVKAGGIFRKGVWGGKNGTLWPIYPEIKSASQAASDHAAIWAEIDV